MRSWYTALAAGLVLAVGCNQSDPGGPGTRTSKKPVVGQANDTFKLEAPSTETSIKQGETKTVTVSIDRGTNFDQDVKLEMSEMPKGITVTPSSTAIKASDKEVQLTIVAAKDAALGHHTITLWGVPARDPATKTSVTLKIEVKTAG